MTTADALFAEVVRAPDDLALRAVWGDELTRLGDPRGELVALQLARGLGGLGRFKTLARERALLQVHAPAWAGALGRAFRPTTWIFEGGVLVGGELVDLEDRAMLADPAWPLISTLIAPRTLAQLAALLGDPRSRIARLLEVDAPLANELAHGEVVAPTVPIRTLGADRVAQLGALATCVGLPALAELELAGSSYERAAGIATSLVDAPVLARLAALRVATADLAAALPALLRRASTIQRLGLGPGPRARGGKTVGVAVELARPHPDGPLARFTAVWSGAAGRREDAAAAVLDALAVVPAGTLTDVAIDVGRGPLRGELGRRFGALIATQPDARVDGPWPAFDRAASLPGAAWSGALSAPELAHGVAWRAIAELAQPFATVALGGGRPRPLGDDPAATIAAVAAMAAPSAQTRLAIQRGGHPEHVTLARTPARHDLTFAITTARTPAELRAWFGRAIAAGAHLASLAPGHELGVPEFALGAHRVPPGWLHAIGGAHARALRAGDALARLIAEVPELAIDPYPEHLVFALGAVPPVDVRGRSRELARAIEEALERYLDALAPAWFLALADVALPPIAALLGVPARVEARQPRRLALGPADDGARVTVDLRSRDVGDTWSIQLGLYGGDDPADLAWSYETDEADARATFTEATARARAIASGTQGRRW